MSVGRLSNNQLTNKLLFQMRDQLSRQEELFEQISSNKRLLRPSDDPLDVGKSLKLRDQIQRIKEYDNVIKSANVTTNIASAAFDNAIDSWKRVNEIAISAADGTKTASDRQGMAEELEQLLQHLVQTSNTTHNGRYIFGGSEVDKPAFRAEKDATTGRITGVFYQGNSDQKTIKTQDGGSLTINILGSNGGNPNESGSFIDSNQGTNLFSTLIELRDKLENNQTIGLSGAGGVIEKIEKGAVSLTSAQVRIGGAQTVLELDKNRIIEENSTLGQFLSEIEEADTVQLILELNNAQNTYEAAMSAGGRLLQTGLLQFI